MEAGRAPRTWICHGEHGREPEKINQRQLRCKGKIRLKRPSKVVPANQGGDGLFWGITKMRPLIDKEMMR